MEEQTVLCTLNILKSITREAVALLGEEEAKKIPFWKCLELYRTNWFGKIYFLREV